MKICKHSEVLNITQFTYKKKHLFCKFDAIYATIILQFDKFLIVFLTEMTDNQLFQKSNKLFQFGIKINDF